MNISVRWLNRYLQPPNLQADEAEHTLMNLGFPSESRTEIPGPDVRLDLEVTSNRGDVLSHIGAAREIAARGGRTLQLPAFTPPPLDSRHADQLIRIENRVPELCPLFTAHVITGVKVGPSPAWLRECLEAVGQRSISNVVDVTNFIQFEFGNPCHVFDLDKLAGRTLIIRPAAAQEPLTTLDGKKRLLAADEIVVADAQRAQSLAGVIGGDDSQVTDRTVDVVLEMATWDPVAVRRAARRHAIRTDASHRFERIVDARTIEAAAARAAALIVEVAGGKLATGVVRAGAPLPPPATVRFRPPRCRALLGVDVSFDEILAVLRRLEIEVGPLGRGGDDVLCSIPPWRPDLTREVDLIEEIARVRGMDSVSISPTLNIAARAPQPTELARRELAQVLTGLGFFETVTFSFTTRAAGKAFLPVGMTLVELNDERRKHEPICRPSVLSGLLECRRANQHAGNRPDGGVRLFETGAVFAQNASGASIERQNLALLMDVPVKGKSPRTEELQHGLRLLRAAIEAAVRALAGTRASVRFEQSTPHAAAFDPAAYANVLLDGKPLGFMGLLASDQLSAYELQSPVAIAELALLPLLAAYPPKVTIQVPPAFPAIERDISFIVPESVSWESLASTVRRQGTAPFEDVTFVGTFRGPQIGKGKKSVTARLRFRDPSRTLRHEEVDSITERVATAAKSALGADFRA